MMEKIKEGQLVPTDRLKKLIHHYMEANYPPRSITERSRYPTASLNDLDMQFVSNCLLYCVSHQIKQSIVEQATWESQLQAQEQMKSYCCRMSLDGKWKDQFNFEQAMVFVCKVIAKFYELNFEGMRIDMELESEIYIVMIHCLIGMQLGIKCYELLEKKYWRNIPVDHANKYARRGTLDRKTALRRRDTNGTNLMEDPTDRVKKFSSKKVCSGLKSVKEEDINQFRKVLLSSLYVQPLPTMNVKKKPIQSYCHNSRLSSTQERHKGSSLHRLSGFDKPLIRSMYSTQNSAAFVNELKKREATVVQIGKGVKIFQRQPYSSNHEIYHKNDLVLEESKKDNNRVEGKKELKKLEKRDWNDLIENMKEGRDGNSKIGLELWQKGERESVWGSQKSDHQIVNGPSGLEASTSQSSVWPILERQISLKMQQKIRCMQPKEEVGDNLLTRLDNGPKPIGALDIGIDDSCDKQNKNNSLLKPKYLKREKNLFLGLCKLRSTKINYSMFLVPQKAKLME